MSLYFLDTNHLSAALQRVSPVRDQLFEAIRRGDRFGTCLPALCELEAGIAQTTRPRATRRLLDALLNEIRIWPFDRQDARQYGDLYVELARSGRVLSLVDVLVAVMARRLNATVLTTDRDFEAIPDVPCENWVAK